MQIVIAGIIFFVGFLIGYHLVWYFYVLPLVMILVMWEGTRGGLESVIPTIIVIVSGIVLAGMLFGDITKYADMSFFEIFVDKD